MTTRQYFLLCLWGVILSFSNLSVAEVGYDQGNGVDPCEGPKFAYQCDIRLSEGYTETLTTTYTFDLVHQVFLFGDNGRYEIDFCPFQDKNKLWKMNISGRLVMMEGEELVSSSLSMHFPFDQKTFGASYVLDGAGTINIDLNCKKIN